MENTLDILKREKIVVICRGIPSDKILDMAKALHRGGLRCMEVTFDQSSQAGIDETIRSINLLSQIDDFCVGAGTVMSEEQVRLAKDVGARYIISPDVNESVIRETKRLGMVSIPGALTATEVVHAHQYGADIVKIFPGGLLGSAYVKALRGPLSHIPLVAVGNISETNCAAFIQAGCVGVGVGGNLVNRTLLEEQRFDEITALARKYVEALRSNNKE